MNAVWTETYGRIQKGRPAPAGRPFCMSWEDISVDQFEVFVHLKQGAHIIHLRFPVDISHMSAHCIEGNKERISDLLIGIPVK